MTANCVRLKRVTAAEKQTGENRIGKGKAGPGRPKGLPNKTTTIAKEAIALAAEGLGGTKRLIEWAKEEPKNEHAFWTTIYPKLLPLQVDANMSGKLAISRIELVAPGHE